VSTCGGGADEYLDFIETDLLPTLAPLYRIDDEARLGVAGSSLGGLVSLYACWTRPDIFAYCGVFSPSLWWDDTFIMDLIDDDTGPMRPVVISMDVGTDNDGMENVVLLDEILRTKPPAEAYVPGADYLCLIGDGHAHNEAAWRVRAPYTVDFLYRDPTRVDETTPYASIITSCAP
jgi:predicted alpha/beta superfamily hydrolase